ncbi:hypothetical protein B0T18DRAFT_31940 [Schizothecium vesticola]|uniref:Transmembrane protein n=1 Tax=Schizothecium vesticola TaxID=314040 RepID=A0AA40FAC6_9PEZI|nr:hypothetical protein B0T18DRAFT_31940 [Schizothecium vesticola]
MTCGDGGGRAQNGVLRFGHMAARRCFVLLCFCGVWLSFSCVGLHFFPPLLPFSSFFKTTFWSSLAVAVTVLRVPLF